MHGSEGMSPALGADVGSAVLRTGPAAGKVGISPRNCRPVRGRWEQRFTAPAGSRRLGEVFEQVALDEDLIVFLTLPAHRLLD